jgi:hypothetical protein
MASITVAERFSHIKIEEHPISSPKRNLHFTPANYGECDHRCRFRYILSLESWFRN